MDNNNYKKEFYNYAFKEKKIDPYILNKFTSNLENIFTINNITPYITEERKLNVTQIDVFSRLMMDRIIFIGEPINNNVANIVQAQLLFLQSIDYNADIFIYINSPGGSLYSGLGIYDTMQYVNPDISTMCIGIAASTAALLLCSGKKGKRYSLQHSHMMLHQPNAQYSGQASDIIISANQIIKLKKEIYNIISMHSNKKYEEIIQYLERDYWMNASEAIEFGIIDEILIKKSLKK